MIVGFHVQAQLIERLVVLRFFQVRQFVHDDHPEELGRRFLEQRGDADLAAGLEPAALYAGDRAVQPERVLEDLDPAVVFDLVDRRGVAQEAVFQFKDIVIRVDKGAGSN